MERFTMTPAKERQFKLLYSRRTNRELAKHFGVTLAEIEETAKRLCLGKDKGTFKGHPMFRWTKEQLDRLRELYPDTPNITIARSVGRSVKAVVSKAHQLKLKKTADRLREMGKENVSLRQDRARPPEVGYASDEGKEGG